MSSDPCLVATRSFLVTRALYARGAGTGMVERRGAVHVAFSGVDAASFNTAFISEPLGQPRQEVAEFTEWAGRLGFPYHVYVRDGTDAASEEALRSAGYALLDTEPWMLGEVAETDPRAALDAPDSFEVRPVESSEDFRVHLEVAAAAFEMSPESVIAAFPEVLLADERLFWFTGFFDGRPVATLAAAHADQVLTLQNVGTIPDHRRSGYGTVLTRHGQFLAHRLGCLTVALQASPMGERLYRRLGFLPACHYRIFASPVRPG